VIYGNPGGRGCAAPAEQPRTHEQNLNTHSASHAAAAFRFATLRNHGTHFATFKLSKITIEVSQVLWFTALQISEQFTSFFSLSIQQLHQHTINFSKYPYEQKPFPVVQIMCGVFLRVFIVLAV